MKAYVSLTWRYSLSFWTCLCLSLSYGQAEMAKDAFIVFADRDTLFCSDIRLTNSEIVSYQGKERKTWRKELVHSIYLPVDTSPYKPWLELLASKNRQHVYPASHERLQNTLKNGLCPRTLHLRPVDEKNFWQRELFEVLYQRNGYTLALLKNSEKSVSPFADTKTVKESMVIFNDGNLELRIINASNVSKVLEPIIDHCAHAKDFVRNKTYADNQEYYLELLRLLLHCHH